MAINVIMSCDLTWIVRHHVKIESYVYCFSTSVDLIYTCKSGEQIVHQLICENNSLHEERTVFKNSFIRCESWQQDITKEYDLFQNLLIVLILNFCDVSIL